MKFRSLHKWILSESVNGLLFFAQRMDELLFDYSLDSHKPAALNPPFLCVEALKLVDDIDNELIDSANLNHVLEELIWAIQNDKVSKKLLDVPLEHYIFLHDAPLSQKRLRLEVLSKTLDPQRYLACCRTYLAKAISENKKKDIDCYARTLVTCLINIGVSKAFLYKKTKEFFFLGDKPTIIKADDVEGFFEEIAPTIHTFDVYFLVSKDIRSVEKSIKAFRIEILDSLPAPLIDYAKDHNFEISPDEAVVHVKDIRSFDAFSARALAEGRIDTLKDLFTLFFHKNGLQWKPSTLITQCCIDGPAIVGAPKSSMEKAFDMNPAHASKRLNWMLENLALRFGGSFDKFKRIVDLHGICVTNEVPENQLLNIWISIETLVPSHSGKNKVSNIISAIDPFLRLTYIRRLIDRALADLLLWNPAVVRKILRQVPNTTGSKLALRLLHLLALSENLGLRNDLYSQLKDFHLLRFRLFSLAEALASPEIVTTLLDNHSKKVSWQLRRLYRTRNLLVHAGRTPSYLATLIENGHDYLDLVLNDVMERSCGEYQVETLEQTFELQKLLLERFEKALASTQVFDESNVHLLYQDMA